MSVTNKEKNFISAVVYLHNDGAQAVRTTGPTVKPSDTANP